MKALCYLAMLGQLLFLAYGVFAVVAVFTIGLASSSDVLIAFLTPLISGLSAVLLFQAANRFGDGETA